MPGSRRVRRGFMLAESEEAFQMKIIALAGFNGWEFIYHPPDNRPSANTWRVQKVAPGFPDLTMVRGSRLVFAELKAARGVLSPAQTAWLDALRVVSDGVAAAVQIAEREEFCDLGIGVEVYVWRAGSDDDWAEIERVLARVA